MLRNLFKHGMCRTLMALSVLALLPVRGIAAEPARQTQANVMIELPFTAGGTYKDPFNEVTLDVVFTDPKGKAFRVPAFWAGGKQWKVRYASPIPGAHRFRSESSHAQDKGLHGVTGNVTIEPYTGKNPLYVHGPLRVAENKRHLERGDGSPFFWLGDTWWMGLSKRLAWPEDVKTLAQDRKRKGFNVIQIVMGPPPDSHPFDPRSVNEAGFPWEENYTAIRPEYYDAADERILYLVDEGFTPCLFGMWGYHMRFMGVERAKQHWRYLVARYGALPVVWCIAGEANLSWYLAPGFPYHDKEQVTHWTAVTKYVQELDPFNRVVTIHPTGFGWTARDAIDDDALLDFDMLQTPHGQADVMPITLEVMRRSYAGKPIMPTINGEGAYEMLSDTLPTKWTRRTFWLCVMNGAAGHTYGGNGIWQVNRPGDPHGSSPHMPAGVGYGAITWEDSMNLPGSGQMAAAKKMFEQYPWHEFTPHPEWVRFAAGASSASLDGAQWIWFPEGNPVQHAPAEKRYLRKRFDVPAGKKIASASLAFLGDDGASAQLNGTAIGSSPDWKTPSRFDVAEVLKEGPNALAMVVENKDPKVTANPAGFLGALDIRFSDGESMRIVSDASWRAAKTESAGWEKSDFDDAGWSPAIAMGAYGMAPWGNQTGAGNQTPHAIGIPDGMRIVYAPRSEPVEVRDLRTDTPYTAIYFDPVSGDKTPIGEVRSDKNGVWTCPPPKSVKEDDWVVILEAPKKSKQP